MGYPLEPSEDAIKKNHRPLDLQGRETALRRTRVGNTPAPYQYSNSKSESDDYRDVRLGNATSQQRLAEVHALAAGMLNRVYGGEEISQEEYIRCLEKICEICQRSVSSPGIAGH